MSYKVQDIQSASQSQAAPLYNKRYLTDQANSSTYLRAIAYDVNVSSLLKVVRTCTYHQKMKYCPVLVSIEHPELKKYFQGDYLLQVYDNAGVCVFDKVLKYEVASWNIFFTYFVFRLDDREEGAGWFYIVKFRKDGSMGVTKVKDIFNDASFVHIGLCSKHLFLANDREVRIIGFKAEGQAKGQPKKELVEVVPKEGQFTTHKLGANNRLLGFFQNAQSEEEEFVLMLIESSSHIIDFAKMTFVTTGGISGVEFQQYREVVAAPEARQDDPITYFKMYISGNEKAVTCAYRRSGHVDFYYDYELIDSSEGAYAKLEMNSRYIYLAKHQLTAKFEEKDAGDGNQSREQLDDVLEIDMLAAQRIGESVGVEKQLDSNKWHFMVYNLIRNHARVFTAITLVNVSFFVAFNKVVAIYDVVKKGWKVFFMPQKVFGLLRNQISTEMHELNVGVLLEDGNIQLIDKPRARGEDWTHRATSSLRVEGRILRVVSDWRDISSHYILSQLPNGKRTLSGFQRNLISNLDAAVELKDGDELIRLVTPNEQEDFLLLNRTDRVVRTFTNTASRNSDKMIVTRFRRIRLPAGEDLLGADEFHSVVGSKEDDFLLFFSRFDLLRLRVAAQEQTVKEKKAGFTHVVKEGTAQRDFNIQNLQVIDSDYCYSLSNESSKQGRPGFYIQNVAAFIGANQKETSNFRLKAAIVGQNDLLDYYKDDQRIAYISSYDTIRIVPLLHRTLLGFIGMRPRNEYLAFRKFRDRLFALDKFGALTVWSVLTGKVLAQKTEKTAINYEETFADYDVFQNGPDDVTYRSEYYQQRVLLVDRVHPLVVDEAGFYGDRLRSELGANSSYVSSVQKRFLRFRVIEILESQEVEELFSFVHPYYGDDKFQRLFFSDDLQHMLERQEQNVILYKRKARSNTRELSEAPEVQWEIAARVKRFPHDLAGCTFVNYLFSPNLLLYLDFNQARNVFVIKHTVGGSDFCRIPPGLMNPGKDIALVGKKFQWASNTCIRVVNNDGVEKVVDITRDCEQLSYCSIPMLDLDYLRREKLSHFFYDGSITRENQTIERLKRKYQQYFSAYHAAGKREPAELYETLFAVDFNVDSCRGKVVADVSFTYFHWKIAELMQTIPRFSIKRYHPEEIKTLALNIFPLGQTVLHYAYQNLHIVQRFYTVIEQEAKKQREKAAANEEEHTNFFEIPFMPNFKGETPLHLCLASGNIKSADAILQKLCNDPIDSHARAINDVLPRLVEAELPCIGAYLDSRFGQYEVLKEFRRGAIRKFGELEYGMITAELWPDRDEIKQRVFDTAQVDSEVKLEFLDVVGVHCYTEKIGDEFFDALAETDQLAIFGHRSVQAVIDFKWPLAREFTIKVLLLPFVLYLAVFWVWSNFFNSYFEPLSKEDSYGFWVADKVLCAFLLVLSVYFLTNEVRQMFLAGWAYLGQFWNYVDFVPTCLIIALVSAKLKVQYFEQVDSEEINIPVLSSFHALASFLMWLKLLYFMRIFTSTGYLVKIITECIKDMRVFLLIFLTVIVAFNEAFQRLSESSTPPSDDNPTGGQFNGKNYAQGFAFTFALAIGDTRTDAYDDSVAPVIVWIIFCLVLLFMNVVMLNLLVAIISKSFEEINDNWEQTMYQERACIISENAYLIPHFRKVRHSGDRDQYLLVARDVMEVDNDNTVVEQVQNKINEIEAQLVSFKQEYRDAHEEFANGVNTQLSEIIAALPKKA